MGWSPWEELDVEVKASSWSVNDVMFSTGWYNLLTYSKGSDCIYAAPVFNSVLIDLLCASAW